MGIGGLAVRPSRAAQIGRDLKAINAAYGVTSEVMWKAARPRRDDIFRTYIELLASMIRDGQVHVHIRFMPIRKYDHSLSGPRTHIDTISKAFYQILLHRAGRFYGMKCRIHVRPDNGCCTDYLPKMLPGLNTDISKRFGVPDGAVGSIQAANSKNEPMLQLLDVTLGALTCVRNGYHEDGTVGPYKAELARFALDRLGVASITDSTLMDERQFNIWNVTPKW